MTATSPRTTTEFNGLGCSGPVAGYNRRKQRAANRDDTPARKQERRKITSPSLTEIITAHNANLGR